MSDERPARVALVVASVSLLVTLLLAVSAAPRPPLPLPVTVDLRGLGTDGVGERVLIGVVAERIAVLLPAAAVGVGLLVAALRHRTGRQAALVVTGAAGPVVVFLAAQLNGVSDLGALVLIYASTAGGVLLRVLQERSTTDLRPAELPLWLAAMVGIVPWGVIALHQVGADLTGFPPGLGVRVLTLAVLAATIAEFAAAWRGRRRREQPGPVELLLVALPAVLLAALGVLVVP